MLPISIPASQQVQPYSPDFSRVVVVAFTKSRSRHLSTAISFGQLADHYSETQINQVDYYFCGFPLTLNQIQYCIALIQLVATWKGSYIFINNKIVANEYGLLQTLQCYLDSLQASSVTAHCVSIVDNLVKGSTDRWSHPCKIVLLQQQYANKLDAGHPASLVDQLKAKAVQEGCDWCPNFVASRLCRVKPVNMHKPKKKKR